MGAAGRRPKRSKVGVFFLNRQDRGVSAHLHWRVRLFWVGAGLALAGIYLEESWLVWVAIVILLTGIVLRFVPNTKEESGES